MKRVFFFVVLIPIFFFGQQKCEVLMIGISQSYQGDCKNGLAHGKGIAKGENIYKGAFKKGLPSGKGIMTYFDGGIFIGNWKKGMRDGEGKYTKTIKGLDSVVDGIWKADKFEGKKRAKQFEVFKKTSISRYVIRKKGNGTNRVSVKASKKGRSIEVDVINFSSGNARSKYGYTFFDAINFFPFVCEIRYMIPSEFGAVAVEAEFSFRIFEPGEWEVEISH